VWAKPLQQLTEEGMTNAFGIDISKWNTSGDGTKKVDFDVIKANKEEVVFIAARAGVSWAYEDPQFSYYWEEMRRIRVCRIAYHVLYFGESSLSMMDNLFKILGNTVDWEHDRIALDLEVAGINTRDRITSTTQKCLDLCKSRTGRYPMVYSRAGWADQYLSIQNLPKLDWWLAQYRYPLPYPLYIPEHPGPPILPKNVSTWLIHQNAEKGKGIGTPGAYYMDYNRWNGDKSVAYAYFNYKSEPPVPPPPVPYLFQAKVITTALYERSGPGVGYGVVGALLLGDVVEVYEVKDGWYRVDANASIWCSGNEKYIQVIGEPPAPPQPVTPLFQIRVKAHALYKRSGPAKTYPVVGYLLKDAVVDVFEERDGWLRLDPEEEIWCSGYKDFVEKI
jgi:GH25 family lysozyme M1 (1,4-beta-N-acetylmuramidase)